MRESRHNIVGAAALAAVLLLSPMRAGAQWEPVSLHHGVWGVFITPSGNILYSDYQFDGSGGIYTSTDEGDTFTKTCSEDHTYNRFYQFGEMLYATGNGGKIARSDDDGETWVVLDYGTPDGEKIDDVENTACYGLAEKGERLYAADFSAGILYSDDYGDTWHFTDRTSLAIACGGTGEKDEKGLLFTENFYTPYTFKGNLYEFGANYICRYDEQEDKWSRVMEGSNFMVALAERNDTLFCGRTVDDYDATKPFLQFTTDGEHWQPTGRPENELCNYVRCLEVHGKHLFAGHIRDGVYVSDDGGNTYVNISDGLPMLTEVRGYYLSPLELKATDDYLYASLFDTAYDNTEGGLYRFPLNKLANRIAEVRGAIGKARVEGGALLLDKAADRIELIDASGAPRLTATHADRLELGTLPAGTYIYKVSKGGDKMTGKVALP